MEVQTLKYPVVRNYVAGQFEGDQASRTGEYLEGIARLWGEPDLPMLTAVDGQWALDWWLRSVKGSAAALLDVIVHDVGLTIVADRYAMSMPRARRMLADGLSLWWARFGRGDVTSS